MRVRAVLTDLDGTLLEPDATVHADVPPVLSRLAAAGVGVCPVTSKTPAEILLLLRRLGLDAPAGFENGAGVRLADGSLTLSPGAVGVPELDRVLAGLRTRTGAAVRCLRDLGDRELSALTGLEGEALQAARQRVATLPLLVDPALDAALEGALPPDAAVRLVRGNRFLHLQGRHDKADVVPRLLQALGSRDGVTVACGDAPNDAGLLELADVRVIVPSARGPHPVLRQRFPDAVVAPFPHGRGWAAAVASLLEARP